MFLKIHSASILTPLALGFLLMITAAAEPVYAAKKKLNWRIGLGRMINTVYYGYNTQRCSKDCQSNSTLITTDINKTSSGQVYSTSLVIEYLFGGKKTPALFGVEVDVGTSVGQRNFTLEESGSYDAKTTKIGDVTESLNTDYLYGGNIFFSDGGEEGFNWSVGLMTGTITAQHKYSDGGARDDETTDKWAGFNVTQVSTLTIPVEILKIGFEYILETAGIRFEYFSTKQSFFGQNDAEVKDSSKLGKINSNRQKQYETVKLQGGIALVVYARF